MPVTTPVATEDRPFEPEPMSTIDASPLDFADVWCDLGGSD